MRHRPLAVDIFHFIQTFIKLWSSPVRFGKYEATETIHICNGRDICGSSIPIFNIFLQSGGC